MKYLNYLNLDIGMEKFLVNLNIGYLEIDYCENLEKWGYMIILIWIGFKNNYYNW